MRDPRQQPRRGDRLRSPMLGGMRLDVERVTTEAVCCLVWQDGDPWRDEMVVPIDVWPNLVADSEVVSDAEVFVEWLGASLRRPWRALLAWVR